MMEPVREKGLWLDVFGDDNLSFHIYSVNIFGYIQYIIYSTVRGTVRLKMLPRQVQVPSDLFLLHRAELVRFIEAREWTTLSLCGLIARNDCIRARDVDGTLPIDGTFPALQDAIEWLETREFLTAANLSFFPLPGVAASNVDYFLSSSAASFRSIAESIVRGALLLPFVFPTGQISSLLQSSDDTAAAAAAAAAASTTLSASQIYSLMCAAFLGAPQDAPLHRSSVLKRQRWDGTVQFSKFGSMSFRNLYLCNPATNAARERLKCLLVYFTTASMTADETLSPSRMIRFSRRKHAGVGGDPLDQWLQPGAWGDVPIAVKMDIDVRSMFDTPPCQAIVDFANEDFGFGVTIPSCTQEEVLLSIRPELYAGLLFVETLADDEAMIVEGAAEFCGHMGHGEEFRCLPIGWSRDRTSVPPWIVVIDASVTESYRSQFQRKQVARELTKLTAGLMALRPLVMESRDAGGSPLGLSTGGWGTGAFGGDLTLKFLEQLLVASIVYQQEGDDDEERHPIVYYAAYGSPDICLLLRKIYVALVADRVTVSTVLAWIVEYGLHCHETNERLAFGIWLLTEKLDREWSCATSVIKHQKLCLGECGWDLGVGNAADLCSRCATKND